MPLQSLPTTALFSLYDSRRARANHRAQEGREPLTLWYESRIIQELSARTLSRTDRQKRRDILLTHQYEQAILALHLDIPLSPSSQPLPVSLPDPATLTPTQLLHIIRLLTHYRDFPTRELLIEYTDQAITLLLKALSSPVADFQPSSAAPATHPEIIELAAELTDLHRRQIITIPQAIPQALRNIAATTDGPAAILPLLTISLLDQNPALERKAIRLLNSLNRTLFPTPSAEKSLPTPNAGKSNSTPSAGESQPENTLPSTIRHLHQLILSADYLSRFSPRKAARLWHTLSTEFLSLSPTSSQQTIPSPDHTLPLLHLLEIHTQLLPVLSCLTLTPTSASLHTQLLARLTTRALQGDLLARLNLPAPLLPSPHKTAI